MHVRVNFGQQPFMYDIDGLVKVCFAEPLLRMHD